MKIYKKIIDNNKYELILKNEQNQEFKICYGGADLYWLMSDYRDYNSFIITPKEGKFYFQLQKVFKTIEDNDESRVKLLNGNCFEWLSESYGLPEKANKLLIKKEDEYFYIQFIRNKENFSPINTCYISFCLSGSRNQTIANLFSSMFLEYQEYGINDDKPKILIK